MLGGDDTHGQVVYEEVGGTMYRRHTNLSSRVGPAYSYNSGTMLSGAADLYRVVRDSRYLSDLQNLVSASFKYFAKLDKEKPGLYSYDVTGFNNWFNGVLMRGYLDAYPYDMNAETPLQSFQDNLDYSWEKHMYESMLPTNLLLGWGSDRTKQNVEGMFMFAFAAEYAALARFKTEY
ncbi:MAG: hydrolase, partial [Bacteroidales bacterium]|nr:hydrolase [Bacteroidales bacterium]